MPIYPLPQFESDLKTLEDEDRAIYERLKAPQTVVVRFGATYMVGEFLYELGVKPGCGSKLVVRTHRGLELGEMLTSTCPNNGCDKSVSRKEMLEYIDNSGGRDYPFFQQGKVERIATVQDLSEQERIDGMKAQMARSADALAKSLQLPMKVIDAEHILGGEKLTFYFTSEQRIDFREMVSILASEHRTRIEMRQVGARDEARLTADYERCGQHCCCKQFLKVLKPISMRSAKVQKATLDPLKISGRCGRLMCCLRYEDETYEDLRARLPRKKLRVKTEEGWGIVIDTQILTQLALVRLEPKAGAGPDAEVVDIAVAVEELEWEGKTGPTRSRSEREEEAGKKAKAAAHDDDDGFMDDDHISDAAAAPTPPPRVEERPQARAPKPPERREGGERRAGEERRDTPAGGGGGGKPAGASGGSTRRTTPGAPGGSAGGKAGAPRPENRGPDNQDPASRGPTPRRDEPKPASLPPQRPPQASDDADNDGDDDTGADLAGDGGAGPAGSPGGEGSGSGGQRRRRRRRRGGRGGGGGGPSSGGGEGSGGGNPPSPQMP